VTRVLTSAAKLDELFSLCVWIVTGVSHDL
jgi:hypothetical protein